MDLGVLTEYLYDNRKAGMQARFWIDITKKDPLYAYSSADYIEISLAKYF